MKLICIENYTVDNLITVGKEYETNEMESFDGVTAEFYYVTCDNNEYIAIKEDAFKIK